MFIPDQTQRNNAAFEQHLAWVDAQDDLLLKLRYIDAGRFDVLPADMQQRFLEGFATAGLQDFNRFMN